jgi:hypothetical protein
MAKDKSSTPTTPTTPGTTVPKKAKRNIADEVAALAGKPGGDKIAQRYAQYLDDRQAIKTSKKRLIQGLDFLKED